MIAQELLAKSNVGIAIRGKPAFGDPLAPQPRQFPVLRHQERIASRAVNPGVPEFLGDHRQLKIKGEEERCSQARRPSKTSGSAGFTRCMSKPLASARTRSSCSP